MSAQTELLINAIARAEKAEAEVARLKIRCEELALTSQAHFVARMEAEDERDRYKAALEAAAQSARNFGACQAAPATREAFNRFADTLPNSENIHKRKGE